MRALNLMFLALLLTGVAAAQESSDTPDAPGVAVIKISWRREVRNPALDVDPLQINRDQAALARTQQEIRDQNVVREKANQTLIPPNTNVPQRVSAQGPYVSYLYEVVITNTGLKPIKSLVWAYVILDSDNGSEVGRHQFTSDVGIRPGQSTNLTGRSKYPPASVINAARSKDSSPNQKSERVEIVRIKYKDNSVWERPNK